MADNEPRHRPLRDWCAPFGRRQARQQTVCVDGLSLVSGTDCQMDYRAPVSAARR
jgi:hypothetical protein